MTPHHSPRPGLIFVLVSLLAALVLPMRGWAQGTLTPIHTFSAPDGNGANSDGVEPEVGLLNGGDGFFYGVTGAGGAHGTGVIFKVKPDGTGYLTLHSFTELDGNGDNADGAEPQGSLVLGTDGSLYGTANSAGTTGQGTVFKISTAGTGFSVIHTFSDVDDMSGTTFPSNSDGANPKGALILGPGGLLYGTARYGGTGGAGVVYAISNDGTTFKTLYSFTDITERFSLTNGVNADGAFPEAGLVLARDGFFYGTTFGGGPHETGSLFKVSSDGTIFKVLYTFSEVSSSVDGHNPDGAHSVASLVQGTGSDTNFYGATAGGGGFGMGTIFKLSGDGATLTTLHTFNAISDTGFNDDGAKPLSGLILGSDGNYYGVTSAGGPNIYGTIYSISPAGVFTTLHSNSLVEGSEMQGTLVLSGTNLFFGTASTGGSNQTGVSVGTVFKFQYTPVANPTYTITTAALPSAGGNVSGGGAVASGAGVTVTATPATGFTFKNWLVNGTVVSVSASYTFAASATMKLVANFEPTNPALSFIVIHEFTPSNGSNSNLEGQSPNAGLIKGADGSYYGTTRYGAAYGSGGIFKVAGDGTGFTLLHSFDLIDANGDNFEGNQPVSSLVQGSDGFLYGGASLGGPNIQGTIFKIKPDGSNFSVIHTFSDEEKNGDGVLVNADGDSVCGALVFGTDGLLYGTTRFGGVNGAGTVFKLTTDGATFTTLHAFAAINFISSTNGTNADGDFPTAALVRGTDNFFYGATAGGGANQTGTLFKISADGATFSLIHTFSATNSGDNEDGANPVAPLVFGADGALYGTTPVGGENGAGAVFKLPTSGASFTTLHSFTMPVSTGFNADGANPEGALVLGADGLFYGTTSTGGPNSYGTVYKITSNGATFTTLYSQTEFEGTTAMGALYTGGDGVFYGATSTGGSDGSVGTLGTLFKFGSSSATGSLQVTILPAAAVTAGAKWQVDGGALQASAATVTGLSPGSHTIAFNTITGFTSPASQTVAIAASQTATATGTYTAVGQTGSLQVTLAPAGAVTAGAKWQVDSGTAQSSGATVSGLSVGSHTVTFSTVTGYTSPASQTVTIAAGQTTTSTGAYVVTGAQTGSLQVTITPVAAVTAGAQWQVDGGALQSSGVTQSGLTVGSHTLSFSAVAGFTAPANQTVTITANQTATATGAYVAGGATGSLQVTITPQAAIDAGAQWQVDGGSLLNSGDTASGLSAGSHTVSFSATSGFTTPASQSVTVVANQTATASGAYVAVAQTGSLQVILAPADALAGGAQWQVDGGELQDSSAVVEGLSPGNHIVHFITPDPYLGPDDYTAVIPADQAFVVTADYVLPGGTTPFTGAYRGVLNDNSGYLTLTMTAHGKFTGVVKIAGINHAFKGGFDSTGAFSIAIHGAFPVNLSLQLGAGTAGAPTGSYYISGVANDENLILYHTAAKASFLGNKGKTVLHLTSLDSDSSIPQTTTNATLSVPATGVVTFNGTVPGKAAFKITTSLVGGVFSNQCMLYAPLTYTAVTPAGSKAYITGPLTMPQTGSAAVGVIRWVKPAQKKGAFPARIDTDLSVSP